MERFEMTTRSFPTYRLCRTPGLLRRFLARVASNTSGAVAVEFGFMIPVLTLMVVSVIDIGLGAHPQMQVEQAPQARVHDAIPPGLSPNSTSHARPPAPHSP